MKISVTTRKLALLANTVFEMVPIFLALSGITTPDGRNFLNDNRTEVEKRILQQVLVPSMFGMIAAISTFALLFGETESRAVWSTMTFYHLGITAMNLDNIIKGKPGVIAHDMRDAVAFHAVFGVACLVIVTNLKSLASAAGEGKKSKSL